MLHGSCWYSCPLPNPTSEDSGKYGAAKCHFRTTSIRYLFRESSAQSFEFCSLLFRAVNWVGFRNTEVQSLPKAPCSGRREPARRLSRSFLLWASCFIIILQCAAIPWRGPRSAPQLATPAGLGEDCRRLRCSCAFHFSALPPRVPLSPGGV